VTPYLQTTTSGHPNNKAKLISAKFKNLRRVLRVWLSLLSSLKCNIEKVKLTLWLFNLLEAFRDLTLVEWKFKQIL
jgi:hypothetical protein